MKAAKLVSVRLDEDDLAVRLMAWAIKNGQQLKILRFYPCFGDVVDQFDLNYHRGHR